MTAGSHFTDFAISEAKQPLPARIIGSYSWEIHVLTTGCPLEAASMWLL